MVPANSVATGSRVRHIKFPRQWICLALTVVVSAGPNGPKALLAADGSYPTRPVHIIVPLAAGTSGDVRVRLLADKLSTRLGQRFVVENKPGAGNMIGTALVAAAKPDGYTLLAASTPAFAIAPTVYGNAGYDPEKSFTPIGIFGRASPLLIVHPSLPATSLKEFVALAKAKPGTISIAHSGLGAAAHLPAELFRRAAGIDFVYVPYKSESLALPDVLGGQVSGMFAYTAAGVPQIKAGKVRALAVASNVRNAALPDVPTFAEEGYPEVEFHASLLLLAPAGVPKDVLTIVYREVVAIFREPQVRSSYAATGADPITGSPEEAAALIRRELEINGALAKELHIKPE